MMRKEINYFLVFMVLIVMVSVAYAAVDSGYEITTRKSSREYGIQKVWDNVRPAAALTGSYVDTRIFDAAGYTGIGLLFDITQGSLTSFEYKIWWSIDGNTWFQEATETIAASIITDTAAYYTIALSADVRYFKVVPCYVKYVKLQVKGTGTVAGSSCTIKVIGVE